MNRSHPNPISSSTSTSSHRHSNRPPSSSSESAASHRREADEDQLSKRRDSTFSSSTHRLDFHPSPRSPNPSSSDQLHSPHSSSSNPDFYFSPHFASSGSSSISSSASSSARQLRMSGQTNEVLIKSRETIVKLQAELETERNRNKHLNFELNECKRELSQLQMNASNAANNSALAAEKESRWIREMSLMKANERVAAAEKAELEREIERLNTLAQTASQILQEKNHLQQQLTSVTQQNSQFQHQLQEKDRLLSEATSTLYSLHEKTLTQSQQKPPPAFPPSPDPAIAVAALAAAQAQLAALTEQMGQEKKEAKERENRERKEREEWQDKWERMRAEKEQVNMSWKQSATEMAGKWRETQQQYQFKMESKLTALETRLQSLQNQHQQLSHTNKSSLLLHSQQKESNTIAVRDLMYRLDQLEAEFKSKYKSMKAAAEKGDWQQAQIYKKEFTEMVEKQRKDLERFISELAPSSGGGGGGMASSQMNSIAAMRRDRDRIRASSSSSSSSSPSADHLDDPSRDVEIHSPLFRPSASSSFSSSSSSSVAADLKAHFETEVNELKRSLERRWQETKSLIGHGGAVEGRGNPASVVLELEEAQKAISSLEHRLRKYKIRYAHDQRSIGERNQIIHSLKKKLEHFERDKDEEMKVMKVSHSMELEEARQLCDRNGLNAVALEVDGRLESLQIRLTKERELKEQAESEANKWNDVARRCEKKWLNSEREREKQTMEKEQLLSELHHLRKSLESGVWEHHQQKQWHGVILDKLDGLLKQVDQQLHAKRKNQKN